MKIPAKVLYACKAIAELSMHYDQDGPLQIKAISKAQNIPEKFLVQILIRLKNAGLVNSTRGVTGGYSLLKDPAVITLADVIRVIDDTIISANKINNQSTSGKADHLFVNTWNSINTTVVSQLEEITFDQIVAQLNNEPVNYCI